MGFVLEKGSWRSKVFAGYGVDFEEANVRIVDNSLEFRCIGIDSRKPVGEDIMLRQVNFDLETLQLRISQQDILVCAIPG